MSSAPAHRRRVTTRFWGHHAIPAQLSPWRVAAPQLMLRAIRLLLQQPVKGLFSNAYTALRGAGYFDEAFGSWCVDIGFTPGTLGSNLADHVMLVLRKAHLWPVDEKVDGWNEEDLFDVIEFLYDNVSKPLTGTFHSFAECGYHWQTFDQVAGRKEYRERLGLLLEAYGPGYTLNERGEIMEAGSPGMRKMLTAPLPTTDQNVQAKVQNAIDRFQRYGSSIEERRLAVRDLADVLEWLRPKIKTTLLSCDENELFGIVNKFGIRHMNQNQKTDYDPAVWLSWMFYHFLATINASLHLIERQNAGERKRLTIV